MAARRSGRVCRSPLEPGASGRVTGHDFMTTPVGKTSSNDLVLRQAIAFHQAGNLSEAERLYRQVLAFRPDFAEVHVNLGAVLMFQGKAAEGEAANRQGIALKPDYAQGHYRLGDILAFQGKLDEAAKSYRQALSLKRDY